MFVWCAEAKLSEYGSVASTGTTVESESDISTLCGETESESPLIARRSGEVVGSVDSVGQDNSPERLNSPQVNLSSPRCHSSSTSGNTSSEAIGHGATKHSSVLTKEEVCVSELEARAAGRERDSCVAEEQAQIFLENVVKPPAPVVHAKTDEEGSGERERDIRRMVVNFDLNLARERLALLNSDGKVLREKEGGEEGKWFRARIDPSSNSQAEEELRKQIRYAAMTQREREKEREGQRERGKKRENRTGKERGREGEETEVLTEI